MNVESFGQMLRRHRTASGLSQTRLARDAGIDPAYVNHLERGRLNKDGQPSVPGRAIVLALAEVLDVSQAGADRLLVAAGLAPQADWQTRAEVAEAKLAMIAQTLSASADLLVFPTRRTG